MKRAGVCDGHLMFELEDGSNVSCECIEDPVASQIAQAINELVRKLENIAKHPDTPELIKQYAAGRLDPKTNAYLYAFVKCGRKAWHLGDVFDDWEKVDHKRGDYVEHVTFRKPVKDADADDRQLARDYAEPFTHEPE